MFKPFTRNGVEVTFINKETQEFGAIVYIPANEVVSPLQIKSPEVQEMAVAKIRHEFKYLLDEGFIDSNAWKCNAGVVFYS